MWNLDSPAPVQLGGIDHLPDLCVMSPDGRRLVAVAGVTMRIWDLRTGGSY